MKMKRLLPLLLAILLMLTSCGATTKEVELTVDNVSEYLEFKPVFSNQTVGDSLGRILHSSDFVFESYAIRGGSFNNVEITVEITFDLWEFYGEDEKYEQKIVSTFKLPANGSYKSDNYELKHARLLMSDPKPEEKVKSINIVSVSGTFTEN